MKKLVSLMLALVMSLSCLSALAESSDAVAITAFISSTLADDEYNGLTKQYIIDHIGVDVTMIRGDASNFNQQLALYISSGDIPTLVNTGSYSVWRDYALEGAWADLTPYLNEEDYPNLFAYVGDKWPLMTIDGKIYGIPQLTDHRTGHVINIRQDWLDQLGLAVPTTLDEYTEVMRAFTQKDPDGNGINDTYGLSGDGFVYLAFLMGAFGATASEYYILNEDGTVTTNAISEDYKAALTYLRDIYAEGLIDPEMFTCTETQSQTKWGRGEMGIWSTWRNASYNAYTKYDFASMQPDAVIDIIMPPVGKDGDTGVLARDMVAKAAGISYKASEDEIKASLKFLDWQTSPLGSNVTYWGIPGEFFDWDEETQRATWIYQQNNGYGKSGKIKVENRGGYTIFSPLGLELNALKLRGIDTPETALNYKANVMCIEQEPVISNLFTMLLTDEYTEYNAELTNIFRTNMLAFIMGEKDIETEWDAYVAEYLNAGGEEVRQSLLKVYNEANGTDYTFAEQAR